jgi:mRNA interferase MazF
MTRGEVWWHEPEDEKPRPYLVLVRDEAIESLTKLVAVPTTRTVRRLPSEVALDHDDGMPSPCVLSTDNITVVQKALLTRRITKLGADRMHEVCRALAYATGC